MMHATTVTVVIVALEAAKLLGHSRAAGSVLSVALHTACAFWLGLQAGQIVPDWALAVGVLAVCSVLASRLALDSKRRGERLGSWLSGLSSYPWELVALAGLGWWALVAAPVAGWLCLGLWLSPLRPGHWTSSRWRWLRWLHPWF